MFGISFFNHKQEGLYKNPLETQRIFYFIGPWINKPGRENLAGAL